MSTGAKIPHDQALNAAERRAMSIDPKVLDELERLEKAATPGPWEPKTTVTESMIDGVIDECLVARAPVAESYNQTTSNAKLIALLRTHAPALLAAARDAEMFAEAMERGGIDISVCDECGCTVACVPDGMALCDRCAALSRDGGGA